MPTGSSGFYVRGFSGKPSFQSTTEQPAKESGRLSRAAGSLFLVVIALCRGLPVASMRSSKVRSDREERLHEEATQSHW